MTMTASFVLAALVLAAVAAVLWMISLATEDVSTVDVFWGAAFAIVAWIHWSGAADPTPRATLLFAMTAVWGLRLAVYLFRRNRGKGEDRRYAAIRRRSGQNFRRLSLYTVFLGQAALIYFISFPVQFGMGAEPPLGGWALLGAILWGVGFCFEAIGDLQLSRFQADPANAGRVMDQGLWAWTRHPNYFGDFCVWWGIWLVAFDGGQAWTVISPIVMSVFLLKISGKDLLERDIGDRRPGYDEYKRKTSGFLPLPPKGG